MTLSVFRKAVLVGQVSRLVPCCFKYRTRTMDRISKETDLCTIRDLSFEPMELFSCGESCSPSKTGELFCTGRHWRKSCQGCSDDFFGSCTFSLLFLCFSWLRNEIHSARCVSEEKLLWTRCFPTVFPSWLESLKVAGGPPWIRSHRDLRGGAWELRVLQVPQGDCCHRGSLRKLFKTSFHPFNSHNNLGADEKLALRVIEQCTQSHTAVKRQSRDSHSGSLVWSLISYLSSARFWKRGTKQRNEDGFY